MSALTATVLSSEAIMSAEVSLAELDKLQHSIMEAAQASEAINNDDGVGNLFSFARNVRSKFSVPSAAEANQQMPAKVVTELTEQVIPALADIVTEFKQLWSDVQSAIKKGDEGQPLVDVYMAEAENDNSAVMRLEKGVSKLQDLVFEAQMEAMANMF